MLPNDNNRISIIMGEWSWRKFEKNSKIEKRSFNWRIAELSNSYWFIDDTKKENKDKFEKNI